MIGRLPYFVSDRGKVTVQPEPKAYHLAQISSFMWMQAVRKIASRIGLAQGESIPVRAVAHELGLEVHPDTGLLADFSTDSVVLYWPA